MLIVKIEPAHLVCLRKALPLKPVLTDLKQPVIIKAVTVKNHRIQKTLASETVIPILLAVLDAVNNGEKADSIRKKHAIHN